MPENSAIDVSATCARSRFGRPFSPLPGAVGFGDAFGPALTSATLLEAPSTPTCRRAPEDFALARRVATPLADRAAAPAFLLDVPNTSSLSCVA